MLKSDGEHFLRSIQSTHVRSCFSSEPDCARLREWLIAANGDELLGEGVKMISRFAVVPAIPTETGSMRNGRQRFLGGSQREDKESMHLLQVFYWHNLLG